MDKFKEKRIISLLKKSHEEGIKMTISTSRPLRPSITVTPLLLCVTQAVLSSGPGIFGVQRRVGTTMYMPTKVAQ